MNYKLATLLGVWVSCGLFTSQAQVVYDGSFGTSGPVAGPNYSVLAGAGRTVGQNLFHSFSRFDLANGTVATFYGPSGTAIRNVLARVTGGTASTIDGIIRTDQSPGSTVANANFFLINPFGIVFGPNAQVDVGGAFVATTADYLKLSDGGRFDARNPAVDVLTTAPPSAFGFLGPTPVPVSVNRSQLAVPNGKTISVVAGNVAVAGATMATPAGRANLVSVGSAGEVVLTADDPASALDVGSFTRLGSLRLTDGAVVRSPTTDAADSYGVSIVCDSLQLLNNSLIFSDKSGTGAGGNISIVARELVVDDGAGISARAFASGTGGAGGNIFVDADTIRLTRGGQIAVTTYGAADSGQIQVHSRNLTADGYRGSGGTIRLSGILADTIGSGRGGSVTIQTDTLDIAGGARVSSATGSTGNGGDVTINASRITLDGRNSFLFTGIAVESLDDSSGGNAGRISVGALTLEAFRGASINVSTLGPGSGGQIDVTANSIRLDGGGSVYFTGIGAQTYAFSGGGPGGNIGITTGTLRVENGAAITAESFGYGRAGNVTINADAVTIQMSGQISSSTAGDGDGGSVFIRADSVAMDGPGSGTRIATSTEPLSGGNGGDITLEVGSLLLQNNANISASTLWSGNGGNIQITANAITLRSGAQISVASYGPGNAGTIALRAASRVVLESGTISAVAAVDGGVIEITAGDLVYLLNSLVSASAGHDGGNVRIDPTFVVLNHSEILANAITGNGGYIWIDSDYFLSFDSLVQARTENQLALQGVVEVTAPDIDMTGTFLPLSVPLVSAGSQLRPSCAARLLKGQSSFVLIGRGGLPSRPGGQLFNFIRSR